MTLEAIYYVSQIVAVGAILVSLVAIWLQMRQSAKMERAAAQREVLERVSQFTRGLLGEASDHFLLGLNDFEAASGATRMATELHLFEFAFVTESALNMHRDGFFSEGTWAGIEGVMLGMIRTPGGGPYGGGTPRKCWVSRFLSISIAGLLRLIRKRPITWISPHPIDCV